MLSTSAFPLSSSQCASRIISKVSSLDTAHSEFIDQTLFSEPSVKPPPHQGPKVPRPTGTRISGVRAYLGLKDAKHDTLWRTFWVCEPFRQHICTLLPTDQQKAHRDVIKVHMPNKGRLKKHEDIQTQAAVNCVSDRKYDFH